MNLRGTLIRSLDEAEAYFNRSTACLREEHSTVRPTGESMKVNLPDEPPDQQRQPTRGR